MKTEKATNGANGRHMAAVSHLAGLFPGISGIASAFDIAVDAALRYRFSEVGVDHLLLGLLTKQEFRAIVAKAGGRPDDVQLSLVEAFEQHASIQEGSTDMPLEVSERIIAMGMHITMLANEGEDGDDLAQEMFTGAIAEAGRSRVSELALEHGGAIKLLADRKEDDFLEKVFDDVDFFDNWQDGDIPAARVAIPREQSQETAAEKSPQKASEAATPAPARREPEEPSPPKQAPRKDGAKSVADAVDAALRNLGSAAREGELDPCIGREAEIERILSTLRRRRKGSVLLHGEAGVGKTAIAEGLALRMREADVEYALARRPFYELSLGALVSDTKYRGDFEARMTHLIERLAKEKAIVFIDEIHMLVGSGSTYGRGMDGANILKPALARGEVIVIGATTPQEMRELRRDAALMRRFEPIAIREPSRAETADILSRASWTYLDFHDVDMGEGVIEEICRICDLYQPERRFPDKAFDLLDAACVMCREISRIPKFATRRSRVELSHVQSAASRMGIRRPARPNAEGAARLRELSAALSGRLRGQDDAIGKFRDAIFGAALDIGSTGTRSSILLYGPEGCGRSLCVEAFASHMSLPLVQLDMQSLGSRGVHHLIGLPGSGGNLERSGLLVEAADSHPEMVLLVDGVDQADPAIREFLASLIRDGLFQSGEGRTISLRGAWVFLTARESERGSFGFSASQEAEEGRPDLGKALSAQITHAIAFKAVDEASTTVIVRDAAERFAATALELGIVVEIPDVIIEMLSSNSRTGAEAAAAFRKDAVSCLTRALVASPSMRRARLEMAADGSLQLADLSE